MGTSEKDQKERLKITKKKKNERNRRVSRLDKIRIARERLEQRITLNEQLTRETPRIKRGNFAGSDEILGRRSSVPTRRVSDRRKGKSNGDGRGTAGELWQGGGKRESSESNKKGGQDGLQIGSSRKEKHGRRRTTNLSNRSTRFPSRTSRTVGP